MGADNGIDAQTLTVAGFRGSSTAAVAANATAETIATAVNGIESSTGVSATAVTKTQIGGFGHAGTIAFTLGGDATKAISATVTSTSDLTALRDEITRFRYYGITAVGTGSTQFGPFFRKRHTILGTNTGGASAMTVQTSTQMVVGYGHSDTLTEALCRCRTSAIQL